MPPASLLGLSILLQTAAGPCDSELAGRERGLVFGYRQRGDRCEGLYNSPVGGDILSLVSLTQAFGDYDPDTGEPFIVIGRAHV